jgi:predicted  nucleic acid-binding Zn-ribbon protein
VAMEDTIQVRCSRCKTKFRDKASRVRDGYSRQCPSCERMLFFIEGSPNKDLHDALRDAERVRKALREQQAQDAAARAAEPAPVQPSDDSDAPAVERRGFERRSYSSGRSR